MAKKLVPRWKKKPTKRISKRRKLKSALRMIFNYMKSDDYMFAPLIRPQSTLSPAPVSPGTTYTPPVGGNAGTKERVTSPTDVLTPRPRRIVVEHSLLQSERVL
ncbi:hypothetical protein AAHA92_17080 [Salvia divinorum]|uniref:Uncharacterized protein n=1 Tax=Salvia divinorum TaxID=28513 RepID=A0ABD1GXL6_SALDI